METDGGSYSAKIIGKRIKHRSSREKKILEEKMES